MRMTKKPLNLLVDVELVKKARDHGLVISKFLENKLQEYFSFIDAVSKHQTSSNLKKSCLKVGSERFELSTSAMSRRRHNH